jgi:hypothetical protein
VSRETFGKKLRPAAPSLIDTKKRDGKKRVPYYAGIRFKRDDELDL